MSTHKIPLIDQCECSPYQSCDINSDVSAATILGQHAHCTSLHQTATQLCDDNSSFSSQSLELLRMEQPSIDVPPNAAPLADAELTDATYLHLKLRLIIAHMQLALLMMNMFTWST